MQSNQENIKTITILLNWLFGLSDGDSLRVIRNCQDLYLHSVNTNEAFILELSGAGAEVIN